MIDIQAVLPYMEPESYLLFHDAYHLGIAQAISEVIQADSRLIDCGYPCNTPSLDPKIPLAYGGFRLVRFAASPVVDPFKWIDKDAAVKHLPVPLRDPDLADHDPYWRCPKIQRCAYCIKHGLNAPKMQLQ
jgi:hypothetical protein